jgi:hypothetical protein
VRTRGNELALKEEMVDIEEVHFGVWRVVRKCDSPRRPEDLIISSPDSEDWYLTLAEVCMELGVQRNS